MTHSEARKRAAEAASASESPLSRPIPAPVDSGAIGRLNEALAAHWAAGMATSVAGYGWECICGAPLEMSEAAHLAHVAEHLAAIVREHTDRALAEVEQRIEAAAVEAIERSTDWFNEGARRGAYANALLIVRAARREQGRG